VLGREVIERQQHLPILDQTLDRLFVHAIRKMWLYPVADKRLGLLINFGAALLKTGIHRVADGLKE